MNFLLVEPWSWGLFTASQIIGPAFEPEPRLVPPLMWRGPRNCRILASNEEGCYEWGYLVPKRPWRNAAMLQTRLWVPLLPSVFNFQYKKVRSIKQRVSKSFLVENEMKKLINQGNGCASRWWVLISPGSFFYCNIFSCSLLWKFPDRRPFKLIFLEKMLFS